MTVASTGTGTVLGASPAGLGLGLGPMNPSEFTRIHWSQGLGQGSGPVSHR